MNMINRKLISKFTFRTFCSNIFKQEKMRSVLLKSPGGRENLYLGETEIPKLTENEELIKVETFAINRADIMQRQGNYPPPKGVTNVLGLECSGYLIDKVTGKVTDRRVMALLSGGGYAEYAKVHKDHIINIPSNINFIESSAIPEVWLTAYQLTHFITQINKSDTVLIHAASSGVGTALIQLIKSHSAKSISLCSGQEKMEFCERLGSSLAVDRNDKEKVKKIMEFTGNKGVNVILDCVGSSEFDNNLQVASVDSRWVVYGSMGGHKIADVNMNKFFAKRISLLFTGLRNRNDEYKTKLVRNFTEDCLKKFEDLSFKPIIDQVFHVDDIQKAHFKLESNKTIGKLIIKWN